MEAGMELIPYEEEVTVEPPRSLGKAFRLRRFIRRAMEAAVAALNGLAGDYLEEEGLFLSTPMGFVHKGRPLAWDRESFASAFPDASDRVAVFIHGLCSTETIFTDPHTGEHFGPGLKRDLGHTTLFVRYNSGLPLAENGRRLAELLERLGQVYPERIAQILPVGHSMGGLVIRCALAHARKEDHAWLSLVPRVVLLGSPHLGAPLEKLVHHATRALRVFKHPLADGVADFLDFRSKGIKDLRHGLCPKDPKSSPVPGVEHCLAAACLARPGHAVNWLFGDGMVRQPSALGFAAPVPVRQGVFHHMGHISLAWRPEVYGQIRDWCRPSSPGPQFLRENMSV
ncbi:MAG: alpha/beta hydrolase [Proteobacteria bacterium]|nr:alpha/beta hydrolase [Pseudomonadota bacterium]